MIDIYDPSVSDDEAATLYAKETGRQWLKTPEGKQFDKYYNTESNRAKLAEVFDLLDEEVSFQTLSSAFKKLVQSGALRTEQEIREAAERAEEQRGAANKTKYDADNSAWVDSHSTHQIKERAQYDRPFASWLRQRNIPPVVETEYDPVQLTRQKNELKAQRENDRPYLNIPQSVRDFAAQYQKMPFAEVQKQMRDPQFRLQVDTAAKAGLI